ncbi:MAG: hypothetical protein JKY13_03900 [Gammaproteobacteria bacterium]|nr:hypothetical protein [Gammaproteobacteria bacterium]
MKNNIEIESKGMIEQDCWESPISMLLPNLELPKHTQFQYIVFRDNDEIFYSHDKKTEKIHPRGFASSVIKAIAFKKNSNALYMDLNRGVCFYDRKIDEWYRDIYSTAIDGTQQGCIEAYNRLLTNKIFQDATKLNPQTGKWLGQYWQQDFSSSQQTMIKGLLGQFLCWDIIGNMDRPFLEFLDAYRCIQHTSSRGIYGYGSDTVKITLHPPKNSPKRKAFK